LIEATPNSNTNFALFERLPYPILLVADTGQLVYGNKEALLLLKLSVAALANRSWAGIDAQLTLFAWKKHWQSLLSDQRIAYETDLSTDGTLLRPVQVEAVLVDQRLAALFLRDKMADLQLEKQIELLSKNTGIHYWSYNHLDDSWSFDPRLIKDLGLSDTNHPETYLKEDIKRLLAIHLQEKSLLELRQQFKQVLAEGGSFEIELFFNSSARYQRMLINGVAVGNGFHTMMINGTLAPSISPESTDKEAILAKFSIDHANDLIFWARPDGHIAFANHAVGTKLQYTADELKGMPIVEIAPYFNEDARAAFWERLRSEQQFEEEFELTARNGAIVTVLASVNYFHFDQQELACSFCKDITVAKVRQFRSKLSEFTLDTSTDMILWVNPEGEIKYYNERFLNKTGYRPEEIENEHPSTFFPIAEPKRRKRLWEYLRTEGHHEMEVTLKTADGQLIPVKAFFNYITYQGEEFNCVYFRDFTKKKERDLVIKLSTEAIQSAEEIVVWLNEKGEIIFLNQAMLRYIGGQVKDWVNKPLPKVFPQLKIKDIKPGTTLEYSMPTVDGATIYLELSISEVLDQDDTYLMIIGRNFTERYLRRVQIKAAQQQIEDLSSRLQEENLLLREEVNKDYNIDNIITVSPNYQKVLHQVSQVSDTDTTVLILGETGTGKELLARAIHRLSEREDYPLIKVNCAALPDNLIESELFGHEKGAFTGAHERKKGRFELADRGTIFLDEIGELPLALQSKLLRVLQEDEFERVGGTETISVNVRLIAATNRSLEEMVKAGEFRSDLYYRLNVFPIVNIPLRERPEDIVVLAEYFTRKFARQQGKKIEKINTGDLNKLKRYRFPGNIRELENIIERSVVLCQGAVLHIQLDKNNNADLNDQVFLTFEEMQRKYIIEALQKTNGRITGSEGAGRLLGMNDRTLMSKIRKLGIKKREYLI
jgi:PAS domain S-box-containing protein